MEKHLLGGSYKIMMINEIQEQIEVSKKTIKYLNSLGTDIMDEFHIEVSSYRKNLEDKSQVGSIGIFTRKGKEDDEIYFYWGKFKKDRSLKQLKTGKNISYQKLYPKGGGKKFTYSMSVFKKEPLDWEMKLIRTFEPRLAEIREATKNARDVLRCQRKALPKLKKVLAQQED